MAHPCSIDLVDTFLSPTRQRSDLYAKLLATPPVTIDTTDLEGHPWTKLGAMWVSTQEAMSTGLEGLLGGIGLAELEVSRGHLSAKDLKSLVDPLQELHIRSLGLAGMWSTVWSRVRRHQEDSHGELDHEDSHDAYDEKPKNGPTGRRRNRGRHTHMGNKLHEAEVRNKHDFPTMLALFNDVTQDVRHASDAALAGSMDWLIAQNNARYPFLGGKKTRENEENRFAELAQATKRLENEIALFRQEHRRQLVEPFRDFFDPETGQLFSQEERRKRGGHTAHERLFAPGSLFTILAAADSLIVYLESVQSFTGRLSALAQQRRSSRLWFPTGIRKIGHLLAGHHHGAGPDVVSGGQDPDALESAEVDDESSESATLSSQRDREASSAQTRKESKRDQKGKPQNPFDQLMKTESEQSAPFRSSRQSRVLTLHDHFRSS